MPANLRAALGSVLVVLLSLAGCGDDDDAAAPPSSVPAVTWAGEVCQTLDGLSASLEDDFAEAQDRLGDVSDVASAREALGDLLADAGESFATAVDQVVDAGVPDVPQGEEIATSLQESLDATSGLFDEAREAVEQATLDSPGTLVDAGRAIVTAFTDALSQVGTALQDLTGLSVDAADDLSDAFRQAPACDNLF